MGSAFSSLFSFSFKSATPPSNPTLGDLPESCVASLLQYMDPPEICKLALLNRAFRRAASADFVWQSKLPANYASLIQRVFHDHTFASDFCKRDIYSTLSRLNSFDADTKRIWIDKRTGRVCLSIGSKGLAITGKDDRRYWSRIPTEESRFASVAYLQQIWWYEVDGDIDFPFPRGKYSLYFRLQLGRSCKNMFGRRVCNSEHVHGWDKKPVRFQLSTSDGQRAISQCHLKETGRWINYHVGDFVVEDPNTSTKIKYSMMQIDCTHTKGGLCVDSVDIYPV